MQDVIRNLPQDLAGNIIQSALQTQKRKGLD
jgi:hypothetical protein